MIRLILTTWVVTGLVGGWIIEASTDPAVMAKWERLWPRILAEAGVWALLAIAWRPTKEEGKKD